MDADRPVITVYTDGACRGNPGRGGWAWAVPGGRFASGAEPATTNQRMEITAALEALRTLTADGASDVDVVSDSTYVVNCFKDRWWQGWQRRNWKNSQNKPVANRDLWEPLIELAVSSESNVTWRWVKGHSGDRMERPGRRAGHHRRGQRLGRDRRRRIGPERVLSRD